jgi:transposase
VFSARSFFLPRKHFPEEHIADDRPGREPVPTRRVLEAVLWILNNGAQWHMLPQGYPNYKTVHRPLSGLVLR